MLRLFSCHSHQFLGRCGISGKQGFRMAASLADSMEMDSTARSPDFYQNVVVMRHGERMDNFEPLWASTATRPWDPPLYRDGWVRALQTGQTLRISLGFPVHRVFVSPFLRCVQTASEVVTALCAVHDDPNAVSNHAIPIDPSKVKWEEPVLSTRARYEQVFKDLEDKHPTENLLLITHGEGVHVAFSAFKKDAQVGKIEYCAYVKLRRPVFQNEQSFSAGEFKMLNLSGQSGITYSLRSASTNQINKEV